MALQLFINRGLALSKWPIAAFSLSLIPAAISTLYSLLAELIAHPSTIGYFALGATLYLTLDHFLFKKRFMGSSFSTFEHELTHALFAWLTFHRVTKLKVTWNSGGMIEIMGQGNWLISIAPYWFPTLCLPFMVMSGLGRFAGVWWVSAGLGAAYCYHLLSTWRETHSEQTDLQQTSFIFAWLFLPAANIIMSGVVLAFAHGGLEESIKYLYQLSESYLYLLGQDL